MNTLVTDKRVSSAFLATLREEPSTASLSAAFSQKTTATNVMKVDGLKRAIALAEEVIRERANRGSRPDMFEALSVPDERASGNASNGSSAHLSDDASGPALYQPYIPTPIPPRAGSTIPPAPATLRSFDLAAPQLPPPPRVPSIVVLDPQTFYHPPPPLVAFAAAPARPRRSAFGAFAIAFVAPLIAFALIIGGINYAKLRKTSHHDIASTTSVTSVKLETQAAATPVPVKLETPTPVVPVAAISAQPVAEPMLVVEVKSLKSAPSPRKRRAQ